MNLKHLNDDVLIEKTKSLVNSERETTAQILHYLAEIDARTLYAKWGFSSLFEFCLKVLKYSESQASRRIAAARLLKELPQIEPKISSGELSLSSLNQAQTYFRQEKKLGDGALRKEEKLKVLEQLENKSARQTEKVLMTVSSFELKTHLPSLKPDKARQLESGFTEYKFSADDELDKMLKRIKEVLPGNISTLSEVFRQMAKITLERHDPLIKAQRQVAKKLKNSNRDSHAALIKDSDNLIKSSDDLKKDSIDLIKNSDDSEKDSDDSKMGGKKSSRESMSEKDPSKGAIAKHSATIQTGINFNEEVGPGKAFWTEDLKEGALPLKVEDQRFSISKKPNRALAQSKCGIAAQPPSTWMVNFRTRYIPSAVRHEVWIRDEGQCTFRDHLGHRCTSRFRLQIDHVQPFAMGGDHHPSNLRLRCPAHNRWAAIQTFGAEKINQFR